jgi:hypothetical protein
MLISSLNVGCSPEALDLFATLSQLNVVVLGADDFQRFINMFNDAVKSIDMPEMVDASAIYEDEADVDKNIISILEIIAAIICSSDFCVPLQVLRACEALYARERLQDSILGLFQVQKGTDMPSHEFIEALAVSLSNIHESSKSINICSALFNSCLDNVQKIKIVPTVMHALSDVLFRNKIDAYTFEAQQIGTKIDTTNASVLSEGNDEAKRLGELQVENVDTARLNCIVNEIDALISGMELLADLCSSTDDDWEDDSSDIQMETETDDDYMNIVKYAIKETDIFTKLANSVQDNPGEFIGQSSQIVLKCLFRFKARTYSVISNILLNQLVSDITKNVINYMWDGCFEMMTQVNVVSQEESEVSLLEAIITLAHSLSSHAPSIIQFHLDFLLSASCPKSIRTLANIANQSNTLVINYINRQHITQCILHTINNTDDGELLSECFDCIIDLFSDKNNQNHFVFVELKVLEHISFNEKRFLKLVAGTNNDVADNLTCFIQYKKTE